MDNDTTSPQTKMIRVIKLKFDGDVAEYSIDAIDHLQSDDKFVTLRGVRKRCRDVRQWGRYLRDGESWPNFVDFEYRDDFVFDSITLHKANVMWLAAFEKVPEWFKSKAVATAMAEARAMARIDHKANTAFVVNRMKTLWHPHWWWGKAKTYREINNCIKFVLDDTGLDIDLDVLGLINAVTKSKT